MKSKRIIALAISATIIVGFMPTSQITFATELLSGSLDKEKDNKKCIKSSIFSYYNHKNYLEYEQAFKVKNIKSFGNNGGRYGDANIEKAFDGKLDTHWETGNPNSHNFKNEVIITFENIEEINRVVYAVRQDNGYKGYANDFTIYSSLTDDKNDFKLVGVGQAKTIKELTEFKFDKTKFKRLKFVFDKAHDDWASASEFWFFKEDTLTEEVSGMFTDGTYSTLNEGYDLNKISELENKLKDHPFKEELGKTLKLAKEVAKNPEKFSNKVWELDSRGDSIAESQKRKVWNFQDWQPTGYSVKVGDVINVYVDAEDGKPLPKLVFKQMDSKHNGLHDIYLKQGENVITIPEVEGNDLRTGTAKGGVIYTVNPYTEEEQGRKPKIRIENARRYPHYIKGYDNDEDVMKELELYVESLNEDPTLPDVFEVFGDNTLVNVRATYALEYYKNNKIKPSGTANGQDEVLKATADFWGFDGSTEINTIHNYRYATMLKYLDGGGYMNAGNGITGMNQAEQGFMLGVDISWGTMHEIGHNFDTGNRSIGEVTNNILPLHFMKLEGKVSRITEDRVWENSILPKVAKDDYLNNEYYAPGDSYSLQHIAPLWQLQLYKEDFWPTFEKVFRESSFNGGDEETIHNEWVKVSSDILKLDLSEHFARHGMKVLEKTKEYTSKYSKPDKKLWYINDKIYLYNGGKFTGNVNYYIDSMNLKDNKVELNFYMDEENVKNTLGYEVYRDGEIIGFTAEEKFVDKSPVEGINHEYKIVAYDKEINGKNFATEKLFTPSISAEENITVDIHSNFDAYKYVKALSYKNKDISSKIEVISNNVDTSKKGKYLVEYKIEDEGIVKSKTSIVEVVSGITYASELLEESSKVGWGSLQKNKAPNETDIELKRQGVIVGFEKGLGAHANSEVVYNIEDKGFDFFESYIGIDSSMLENNGSATFEVYVDDEKVFTSDILTPTSNLQPVKVPVSGASKIKLVTTDANQNVNNADQTVWADAKFVKSSELPTIVAEDKVYIKLNEEYNLMNNVKATDKEDGDITSNIVIESGEFTISKTGEYVVSYTISDSDGNVATATTTIVVYSDIEYVSDIEYTSGNVGWGTIQKDRAPNGNNIVLIKDGEDVLYEKGLGAHSNSEVIYNLEGKNYDYFESYVGIDQSMKGNASSSTFEVYVDGERVYNSGIFKHNTNEEVVRVSLKGASELKLVTTDCGDGNAADQTVWADAKFIITNSKPILEIPEDRVIKLGEVIDLTTGYKATDAEDGDITNNITIDGLDTVDFNKAGTYKLTYTIKDSNGNVESKTSNIIIYSKMEYISDIEYISGNVGWGDIQKDKAPNETDIVLIKNGQDILYSKGLGAHSNSEVIYNLEGKNYDYFESYMGIDQSMRGNASSSTFEIYVDGEKVYNSEMFRHDTSEEFVRISLKDAKELKLVTTDCGDGNAADQTVWADAKFID